MSCRHVFSACAQVHVYMCDQEAESDQSPQDTSLNPQLTNPGYIAYQLVPENPFL